VAADDAADAVVLGLHLIARKQLDDAVASDPDPMMDPPDRHDDSLLAEGSVPPQGMLIIGVDQRSIDIKDHCERHSVHSPRLEEISGTGELRVVGR
jgi:hypothetical protein